MEISSFYIGVPKIMIRWYTVPEIRCVTDPTVISHLGIFFALLPPSPPPPHIFGTYMYQKLWSNDVWFLRFGARRMDGRTDGWKKWHIQVGTPPKNDTVAFWSFSSCVCNAISYVNVHFRSKPYLCFLSMSS